MWWTELNLLRFGQRLVSNGVEALVDTSTSWMEEIKFPLRAPTLSYFSLPISGKVLPPIVNYNPPSPSTMATETFLFTSESVNEGHPGMSSIELIVLMCDCIAQCYLIVRRPRSLLSTVMDIWLALLPLSVSDVRDVLFGYLDRYRLRL